MAVVPLPPSIHTSLLCDLEASQQEVQGVSPRLDPGLALQPAVPHVTQHQAPA